MKNIFFKSVVVFIIIVSGLSCNSVTGPTDRNPTVRTITTYQGAWTGTTSQGFPISFTVVGNTITSFVIDMLTVVPNGPEEQISYTLVDTVIIAGSNFTIRVSMNPVPYPGMSVGTPVSGHFTSTTTAEGITVSVISATDVTWKAEKK